MEGPDFRLELVRPKELRAVAVGAISLAVLVAAAVHLMAPAASPHPSLRPVAAPTVRPFTTFIRPAFFGPNGIAMITGDFSTVTGQTKSTALWLSLDGGQHWSKPTLPVGVYPVAIAAARDGTLTLTSNDLATGGSSDLSYFVSTDRGRTWTDLPKPTRATGWYSVQAINGAVWIMAEGSSVATETASSTYYRLLRSTDRGRSWQLLINLSSNHPSQGGLDLAYTAGSPEFTDPMHAWLIAYKRPAVGGTNIVRTVPVGASIVVAPIVGTPDSELMATDDGGATWRVAARPAAPTERFAYGLPIQTADGNASIFLIRTGSLMTVWESMDYGMTWSQPITIGYQWAVPITFRTWIASTGTGAFSITSNAGVTWSDLRLKLPDPSNDYPGFAATDVGHLWLWGNPSGRLPSTSSRGAWLLTSDNGGTSWRQVALPRLDARSR